jgi:hypothetical protein
MVAKLKGLTQFTPYIHEKSDCTAADGSWEVIGIQETRKIR